MRISDWSSDVCSSDLLDHGLVEVVVELRFRRRLLQHHRGAAAERLDIGHMPGEEGDHPSGEPPLSPVPANENGRASCRERVCQNVYVPVVDVSLKKNKVKTNCDKK